MARKIILTEQYKRDLKLLRKRGGYDESKLEKIVKLLRNNRLLHEKCDDHALTPPYNGNRGCKIELDWILVYKNTKKVLFLIRTGTHSDLFENPVIW